KLLRAVFSQELVQFQPPDISEGMPATPGYAVIRNCSARNRDKPSPLLPSPKRNHGLNPYAAKARMYISLTSEMSRYRASMIGVPIAMGSSPILIVTCSGTSSAPAQ